MIAVPSYSRYVTRALVSTQLCVSANITCVVNWQYDWSFKWLL